MVVVVLLSALLLEQFALRSSKFQCLQVLLTPSGICMLVGCIANATIYCISHSFDKPLQGHLSLRDWDNGMTHDLIYYGLLPPIVFQAGFFMHKRKFFSNIGTHAGFAVLGTTIALSTTSSLVYVLSKWGPISTPFTPAQALIFGSLIASTDPTATLATLAQVKAHPLLTDLLFGEASLSKTPSIALFKIFLAEALAHSAIAVGLPLLGKVLSVFAVSLCVGILSALFSASLTRRLRSKPKALRPNAAYELAMLLLLALFAFNVAEQLGCSGPLSLFVCAIVMRHYTMYNLSTVAQKSARVTLTMLATAASTCLSVLLGIVFFDYVITAIIPPTVPAAPPAAVAVAARPAANVDADIVTAKGGGDGLLGGSSPILPSIREWDLLFVALALPIIVFARLLAVMIVAQLANRFRSLDAQITFRMQLILALAFCRGPLPFALAITLPAQGTVDPQWSVPIVTTTLAITLLTNLVAPLMRPIIWWLDLRADETRLQSRAPSALTSIRATACSAACDPTRDATTGDAMSPRATHSGELPHVLDDAASAPHAARSTVNSEASGFSTGKSFGHSHTDARALTTPLLNPSASDDDFRASAANRHSIFKNDDDDETSGTTSTTNRKGKQLVAAAPASDECMPIPTEMPPRPASAAGAASSGGVARPPTPCRTVAKRSGANSSPVLAATEGPSMVVPVEELGSLEATPPSLPPPSLPSRMSTIHRAWRMIDREYLQPHFGGRRFTEAVDSDDDE